MLRLHGILLPFIGVSYVIGLSIVFINIKHQASIIRSFCLHLFSHNSSMLYPSSDALCVSSGNASTTYTHSIAPPRVLNTPTTSFECSFQFRRLGIKTEVPHDDRWWDRTTLDFPATGMLKRNGGNIQELCEKLHRQTTAQGATSSSTAGLSRTTGKCVCKGMAPAH